MMKKSLIILTLLFIMGCSETQQNRPVISEQIQANNGVLIIFYDKSETSVAQLLSLGKKWNITLVYDYKSMNGLALRVANPNEIAHIKNFGAEVD
ncbi:hypothetical protein BKK52_05195 [Rodentibacter trehalosifermentans]|uniref:Uncharacterized protein n=1 Tax=Rodentibacter trehalosifermentans TaxID=1908263 RepID=A0A1V3J250_9PAST|nr:hypothetical protein [Rodentibacter trehalosifermentans]OOF48733.1 hypothetical protein BKK52_05195 [Rodentibacter trehalosifermentans]